MYVDSGSKLMRWRKTILRIVHANGRQPVLPLLAALDLLLSADGIVGAQKTNSMDILNTATDDS